MSVRPSASDGRLSAARFEVGILRLRRTIRFANHSAALMMTMQYMCDCGHYDGTADLR